MGMLPALSPRKQLVKLSSSPAEEESKKTVRPWEDARERSWAAASKQLPPVGVSGFPGIGARSSVPSLRTGVPRARDASVNPLYPLHGVVLPLRL